MNIKVYENKFDFILKIIQFYYFKSGLVFFVKTCFEDFLKNENLEAQWLLVYIISINYQKPFTPFYISLGLVCEIKQ